MGQHDDHQCWDRACGQRLDSLRGLHDASSSSMCRSSCWPRRWACGCFTCSINSRRRHGTRRTDWSQPEAALHGSSHYDLPLPLRWFSANIGVHHVHHLSSGVPFYRLPEILRDLSRASRTSAGSRCGKALFASVSRCGTRKRGGSLSFREARAAHAALGAGEASLIRSVGQELCEAGKLALYLSLNASDPILAKGESK